MGIKGGDVVLLCRRYEFLRLHNLDGIRDTGSKPVTCLTQCVLSENTITFRNHDLLVGCIEPKKCVANLEVDTPADVFVLSLPLGEDSVCLRDVCLNSPAAPDRKINCSENREHSIGLSGIHAGHKVAAVKFDCRSFFGLGRLSSLHRCPNLGLGRLEVGPVRERLLESLSERSDRSGTVFHRRRKCEVLPKGQTNKTAQSQLLTRQIGFERNKPQALCLEFHLAAINVDARVHARFELLQRLFVNRLSRSQLGFSRFHPGCCRNNL